MDFITNKSTIFDSNKAFIGDQKLNEHFIFAKRTLFI